MIRTGKPSPAVISYVRVPASGLSKIVAHVLAFSQVQPLSAARVIAEPETNKVIDIRGGEGVGSRFLRKDVAAVVNYEEGRLKLC